VIADSKGKGQCAVARLFYNTPRTGFFESGGYAAEELGIGGPINGREVIIILLREIEGADIIQGLCLVFGEDGVVIIEELGMMGLSCLFGVGSK